MAGHPPVSRSMHSAGRNAPPPRFGEPPGSGRGCVGGRGNGKLSILAASPWKCTEFRSSPACAGVPTRVACPRGKGWRRSRHGRPRPLHLPFLLLRRGGPEGPCFRRSTAPSPLPTAPSLSRQLMSHPTLGVTHAVHP